MEAVKMTIVSLERKLTISQGRNRNVKENITKYPSRLI